MADNPLAHAPTGLVNMRRRTSLAHAPTCLAAALLWHSLAHSTPASPAAQSLCDGPLAGAAMPSGRTMQNRMTRQTDEGCLTTRCRGGHEAQFLCILVRPFVAPLNVSVGRRVRNERRVQLSR